MTDRELLIELYGFLSQRNYITADKVSVTDMTQRYQNPPMTLLNRAAMQMTLSEYNHLGELLKQVSNFLKDGAV